MRFLVLARAKNKGLTGEERKLRSRSRRLSRLQSTMVALQTKLRRDLRSSDPDRFLTALAVGLMAETSEDPVLSWRKKNVQLEDDRTAFFRSKGKRKPITNATIVQALADAYEAVEDGNDPLFTHDTGQVTGAMVNEYLGGLKLSVKDIRGYNAGRVIQERLAEIRSAGPELPRHKRSRTKLLQGEFFKALDETAADVGLAADLIRSSYLPPGLEASYLSETFEKAALGPAAVRVASRFMGARS